MALLIAGTFSTGQSAAGVSQQSGAIEIPTSTTTAKLTLSGLDASNTVRTEKRTTPGGAWSPQVTYSSDQSAVGVTVAAGEQWRLATVAMQAIRSISYKLTCES